MKCNLKCEFCYYVHLKPEERKDEPLEEMTRKLSLFRNYYHLDYVDITGGEPTVYPYIREMVHYSAEIGLKPTIITNAQIPQIFSRLIDLGLEDLLISIHGVELDHDKAVCREGAFRKIVQTIEILKERGFTFRTNTVVQAYNYKNLSKLAEFFTKIEPRICNFIIFNPHESTPWSKRSDITFQVRYSEIASHLKEAIDVLMNCGIWSNVRYMPLCTMRGYEKHVCNFMQWQYDPYEWDVISSHYLNLEQVYDIQRQAESLGIFGDGIEKFYNFWSKSQISNHIRLPACSSCANDEICDHLYSQYVRSYGVSEFEPLKGEKIIDPLHYRKSDMRWAMMKS
jgi:MoaA/NifB/PqqE/SkfB family radical SAM enzyme